MGSDDFTVLISLTDTLKVPLKILVEFFYGKYESFLWNEYQRKKSNSTANLNIF